MTSIAETPQSTEFKATYVRTPIKDAIGGKLYLNDNHLIFKPNKAAEKLLDENSVKIPLNSIRNVEQESAGRGIIYSLTGGRLAGHLHINQNDGTEYVFTVFSASKKVEVISDRINSTPQKDLSNDKSPTGANQERNHTEENTRDIAEQENPSKTENQAESSWNPAFPVFSVFTGLMLIWAGTVQSPGNMEGFFLIVAGGAVIPRVRRRIVTLTQQKIGVDFSWNRDDWENGAPDDFGFRPIFLAGMAYSILLLLAIAIAVMEAANDPTMSAGGGLTMTVLVFILAIIIVYGIRGFRRLTSGQ